MNTLADLTATTPGLPCRTDPDRWYSPDRVERHDAAQQCRACPLLLDCMRYALAADEQHGVWGGVDFESRAVGCGTERGYRVHLSRREQPCPACQAAHDEAVEADRRRRLAAEHGLGGTVRGYWVHRSLGEEACRPCKSAMARKTATRRERAREAAERSVTELSGRRDAEPARAREAGVQRLAIAS